MENKKSFIVYKEDFNLFIKKYNVFEDIKNLYIEYNDRNTNKLIFHYNINDDGYSTFCPYYKDYIKNNICSKCNDTIVNSNLKCRLIDFKNEIRIEKIKTIL